MGCKHYFVVDRLEDLVDGGDSRSSSRADEHEHFRLVSQLHVAIQTLQKRCPPLRTVWTNRLVVQSQRVSPFYLDLHLRLCLCLCQTNKLVFLQSREKCIDFLNTRTGRLFCHDRSPCSINWIRVWLGWLVVFCLSSNFWTQFLHPIISQGNLRRGPRWRIFFLVFDFSSFHHDSFRDTTSWECIVKDDCITSCLIAFESFTWSKLYISTKYTVPWCLFQFLLVPCKTR